MDVYWFELAASDVPAPSGWLSQRELAQLDALRFAKRRADWLLGRWTAKQALAAYLQLPSTAPLADLANLEIAPAPSGAPDVYIENKAADISISLSHRSGVGFCAVGKMPMILGCDLEEIEPHSDAFVDDYLAPDEQYLISQTDPRDRATLITLIWSAKESALKALRTGLRLDTRSVVVNAAVAWDRLNQKWEPSQVSVTSDESFGGSVWQPMNVSCASGEIFEGWWQQAGRFLRTLVGSPPPNAPTLLRAHVSGCLSNDRIGKGSKYGGEGGI